MAQQRRMLYSSIYANAELNMRPIEERLLYIGTIVLADDDGKLRADPRYLKGQVFPYDEKITSLEVENWLKNLADVGQILLYERDGIQILKHPNWAKYQHIRADLYVPSKLPSPLRARNEPVTATALNISNISKERSVGESVTPQEQNREFFSKGTHFTELLDLFSKDKNRVVIEKEFEKFWIYWTEPNKSGSQVKWEQQSTFDVKRRLWTWLNRSSEFKRSSVAGRGLA